jgi:hypothetical protein
LIKTGDLETVLDEGDSSEGYNSGAHQGWT